MLLVATALLTACQADERSGRRDASPPQGGTSAWSIDRARVLFTARRGNTRELYLLDRATGATTRLTRFSTSQGGASAARVSPDGKRVAFQVRRGSDIEIFVRALAADSATNVTKHPDYDVSPVWSPDGRRLAFMSTRGLEPGVLGPFPGHIYVTDLEDGTLRRVTRTPLTSSLGPSDWSADGSRLLMARAAGESISVYLIDVATGTETRVTAVPQKEYSVVFSRSGDRIAFHAEGGGESQIVVTDLDGGNRRTVTSGPGLRYYPRWSPDDEWILFTASEDGQQYDLRAVRVRDGAEVVLVATPEDEREGEWLPSP